MPYKSSPKIDRVLEKFRNELAAMRTYIADEIVPLSQYTTDNPDNYNVDCDCLWGSLTDEETCLMIYLGDFPSKTEDFDPRSWRKTETPIFLLWKRVLLNMARENHPLFHIADLRTATHYDFLLTVSEELCLDGLNLEKIPDYLL